MIDRRSLKRSGLGLGFVVLVSCGGDDHGAFLSPNSSNDAGAGNRAGASGRGGAGGAAGAAGRAGAAGAAGRAGAAGASGKSGANNAGSDGAIEDSRLAPKLEVTKPSAVADPNQGEVLTESQVGVTCRATASTEPGAKKVLASSVRIQMLDAAGNQLGSDGNVHSTQSPDEYAASFTLTDVPNGPVSFKCSATDDGVPARIGSATLSTFLDHGPKIALETPEPSSAYPISPAILFQFSASDAPLSKKDKKAGVVSVSLNVNGVDLGDVTAHELAGAPGEYRLPVDLADPTLFTPPPTGSVPVRIVATNKRGVTRMSDFSFNVDNVGPVIQVVSPPTPNQFIGGKVTLSFTVTDKPAGVAPETVQVELKDSSFSYSKDDKNWSHPSDNVFTYTFDTKNFDSAIILGVTIRANDLAGNKSKGVSVQYYLDNAPPTIDMSPPPVQERRYESATKSYCSAPFFPLGDSPRDFDPTDPNKKTLPTVARFRALIWDEGNHAQGQHTIYYSDIDTKDSNTVPHLYFQTDTSKPLLKYSDPTKHGQICNAIADETLPFLTLVPIPPMGNAFFSLDAPVPAQGGCVHGADTEQNMPQKLCSGNSDLTRVIQHESALASSTTSVVYGVQGDAVQCTGQDTEVTNFASQDGWICAAVTAVDGTGNRSVSAPLRLCFDSDLYPGTPACAISSVEPPSCVEDCIAPPHFDQNVIDRPH